MLLARRLGEGFHCCFRQVGGGWLLRDLDQVGSFEAGRGIRNVDAA